MLCTNDYEAMEQISLLLNEWDDWKNRNDGKDLLNYAQNVVIYTARQYITHKYLKTKIPLQWLYTVGFQCPKDLKSALANTQIAFMCNYMTVEGLLQAYKRKANKGEPWKPTFKKIMNGMSKSALYNYYVTEVKHPVVSLDAPVSAEYPDLCLRDILEDYTDMEQKTINRCTAQALFKFCRDDIDFTILEELLKGWSARHIAENLPSKMSHTAVNKRINVIRRHAQSLK